MNPFFDHYLALLEEEADRAGLSLGSGAGERLGPETARALLDLTRVIAHSEERRFGPLAAYLTGVALSRVTLDDRVSAELIDKVRGRLEDTP